MVIVLANDYLQNMIDLLRKTDKKWVRIEYFGSVSRALLVRQSLPYTQEEGEGVSGF